MFGADRFLRKLEWKKNALRAAPEVGRLVEALRVTEPGTDTAHSSPTHGWVTEASDI